MNTSLQISKDILDTPRYSKSNQYPPFFKFKIVPAKDIDYQPESHVKINVLGLKKEYQYSIEVKTTGEEQAIHDSC